MPCIVVTGASRGIGAAIAARLAGDGADVACLSRSGELPEGFSESAAHLRGYRCDVTSETDMAEVFEKAARENGGISGLVNNAGLHIEGPSNNFASSEFARVLSLNVVGLFAACREAYPYLRKSGGLIVNIGSFYDKIGVRGNTAYCASKAAVGAITRCLAVEWARDRIMVIDIAPGYIETSLNRDVLKDERVREKLTRRVPVGRIGLPQDVAGLVGALFRESPTYLTGETVYVDGGQGIAH
jgi:NAD(P)-dependent dehydrogenase (short-subunit alcohol dehydrogenase family)